MTAAIAAISSELSPVVVDTDDGVDTDNPAGGFVESLQNPYRGHIDTRKVEKGIPDPEGNHAAE